MKKCLLTLTIVDTNRRTRAATCRKMIPISRTSIFTGDLRSDGKRRQCVSHSEYGCECVRVRVWSCQIGGTWVCRCSALSAHRIQRNFTRAVPVQSIHTVLCHHTQRYDGFTLAFYRHKFILCVLFFIQKRIEYRTILGDLILNPIFDDLYMSK